MVQRVRLRYAKRDRLRFTSHRDFARAFERALRRAAVPMAYSAGFNPHPKVSYVGAAPTGVASEAEYLEIALAAAVDVLRLRDALDAALPPGLDVLECVEARPGTGALPDRIDASTWRVELGGTEVTALAAAVAGFLDRAEMPVERLTRDGRRVLDARGPVVRLAVVPGSAPPALDLLVRQTTPTVRPDDILTALRTLGLDLPQPPRTTRLAQGSLDPTTGTLTDPLTPDRPTPAPT